MKNQKNLYISLCDNCRERIYSIYTRFVGTILFLCKKWNNLFIATEEEEIFSEEE